MGTNAVHRLAPVLVALSNYTSHRELIDGCEFAEQLQAVFVEGGVASNVVPDRASVTVNYRFTPECDVAVAMHRLERLLAIDLDAAAGDRLEVLDAAPGALPALGHPVLAALVAASGGTPRAKVGWTDVATFSEIGVPATNFGPGDPLLAHTAHEHVSAAELAHARRVLASWLNSED
jgi:succinyl-diaminopimelate desuccinylase